MTLTRMGTNYLRPIIDFIKKNVNQILRKYKLVLKLNIKYKSIITRIIACNSTINTNGF